MISSEDIGALAQKLTSRFVGLLWSEADMRKLISSLGWEWTGDPGSPMGAATGLPGGDAVLIPVGAAERHWAPLEEYLELVVPLSQLAPEPRAQAEEFRRAADAVRHALGDATYAGSHGSTSPYGRRETRPLWGSPFLRWRRERVTLELRAGADGPELVLQPSEAWERWYSLAGRGFVGVLEDCAAPLQHPRWELAVDWDTLQVSIGAFLRTLPAVTAATGVSQCLALYGRVGEASPIMFDIVCDDRLYLGYCEYLVEEAARGENAAKLGWTCRESLPEGHIRPGDDGRPPWRVDAGGPGEVRASEMAALIVRTARAAGVAEATDLIIGGEGECRTPYSLHFAELAMATG
ncbi:hypothetical protein [Streptomyces hygroscopicus]|uniref:hypothetical protein n=1 Tax=Streptomyces hygroscopicus TaxID=1912 RepID=UPI001FCAFCF9|nr:hypothetical protein [Streptomyces hygroscopicus]BDH10479.1 hypothetical protein HOK021_16580 [Streptomyces hygroscopicus]